MEKVFQARQFFIAGVFFLLGAMCSWLWLHTYCSLSVCKRSVGIIYVPSRMFHKIAADKLKDLLCADERFVVAEWHASSSRDEVNIKALCAEALESSVDLLVVMGMRCSRILVDMAREGGYSKPIIFISLNDPVSAGVIAALEKPEGLVTGVTVQILEPTSINPCELLFELKSDVRGVLIPYAVGSTASKEAYVQSLVRYCKSCGVKAKALAIPQNTDPIEAVARVLPAYDTLLYVEGDALAEMAPALGELASQYGVTFFAGSIDGAHTASLTYAPHSENLAWTAYALIKKILVYRQPVAECPVQQLTVDRELILNLDRFKSQGLRSVDVRTVIHSIRSKPALAQVRSHIRVW